MAYKRNPMRAERIASLARFVDLARAEREPDARVQCFERTLDDSANRRLSIPEAFLATDAILVLAATSPPGSRCIRRASAGTSTSVPFMATER